MEDQSMDLTNAATPPQKDLGARPRDTWPYPPGMQDVRLVVGNEKFTAGPPPRAPSDKKAGSTTHPVVACPVTSTPAVKPGGAVKPEGANGGGIQQESVLITSSAEGVGSSPQPATVHQGAVDRSDGGQGAPPGDTQYRRERGTNFEHKVKLLATFDGKENWDSFIGPLERLATKRGWSDALRLDALFMRLRAR